MLDVRGDCWFLTLLIAIQAADSLMQFFYLFVMMFVFVIMLDIEVLVE